MSHASAPYYTRLMLDRPFTLAFMTPVDHLTDVTISCYREFPVNSMPSFNSKALPSDNTFQVAFVPNGDPTMENIISNFEEFINTAKSPLEIACPGKKKS